MKKEDIKKNIVKFSEIMEKGSAEINIILINQNNNRKKPYRGYMLKTKLEDIKGVISDSLEFIINQLDKRTLDIYDLEISIDDSVQIIEKEDVIHGKEILEEITLEYKEDNTIIETTDLSKIKFMVIQIYNSKENKSIYLFKKYVQPSKAYRKSQKYIFSGGLLRPFMDEIITINSNVDAILMDEYYYIFNRNSFNSIFNYKDVFKKILDENSEMIRTSGLMSDPNQFVKDCEANGRHLTRLTKIILAKGFEEVSKKKEDIPTVVKEFNLSIKISENGQIIYRGKEDIPEILNLLLRHYVIDALTSDKMIAAAIHEYQVGSKGGIN